jgi:hypothetical protein
MFELILTALDGSPHDTKTLAASKARSERSHRSPGGEHGSQTPPPGETAGLGNRLESPGLAGRRLSNAEV